jgi:hypothetical protein
MSLVDHLIQTLTPLELAKQLAQHAKDKAALQSRVLELEVELFWMKVADRVDVEGK